VLAGSAAVDVLNEMLANPTNFYLNLHTTVNPGGAVRGQLKRTEYRVFGAVMSPANEVPAITNSDARGMAFITMLAGVEPDGEVKSAEVSIEINYTGFAEGTQFTGFHIHQGRAGANGPVTIDSTLSRAQNILAGPNGAGNLRYVVDANTAAPATVNTIYTMLQDPGGTYLNLHTVANPGGEIRAQLRPTEAVRFPMLSMLPRNEVPPLQGLDARGDGSFAVHLLRRPDGTAMAGLTIFDVNHSFPGETTFTGLHIHNGAADANGPVVLDSGIRAGSTVASATGFGNIYRTAFAMTDPQLTALNGLLANPRSYYINLHTSVNPGGAVRTQLLDGTMPMPRLDNVIQSVSDPARTTLAQGGLMTLYGTGFAGANGSLEGWQGARAPLALNGVAVSIDGREAPIVEVRPSSVIAQVPFETASGPVDLTVRTPAGTSNRLRPMVSRVAPSLFFDQINADGYRLVAFEPSTGAVITQSSPAAAGATLVIFGTGFGQPSPAQETGATPIAASLGSYSGVRVTIGGRDATGVTAQGIPGFLGFTQISFTLPAGSGAVRVELEYQGARANQTVLYMR
jgi:uncharacterized protein (TIGR03437 family)